jgi:hypothetical protein
MGQTHKQLEKEGWIRQFLADAPLAKDAVEIYDLLGYEVHLQSPKQAHSKKKGPPSSVEFQSHFKIVYIRPRKSLDDEEE